MLITWDQTGKRREQIIHKVGCASSLKLIRGSRACQAQQKTVEVKEIHMLHFVEDTIRRTAHISHVECVRALVRTLTHIFTLRRIFSIKLCSLEKGSHVRARI